MEIEIEESGGGGIPLHMAESEADLEKIAELDYQRMKRQYFLMQKNRHSVMEKAGSKQVRSMKLVKILELQRDNLESELTAATSPLNQKRDLATKEKIWELLQIYEQYKTQVESLTEEIEAMQKTVIKMTSKFYKTKLHLKAVMGCAIPVSRMEKSIENSEKKLHMIKSNYDTLMSENRALKEEISLKINRRFVIFQRMEKLHRRMHECRTDLHSSVDEAIQVYNIWDETHQKINFIKEKHKDEVRSHVLQMKEYDRLLFHDIRELRFYSIKNKPRQLFETADIRDARKVEEELRQLLKDVRKYKKQFQQLEQFDPLQNEQSIIYTYKTVEQQNFAHFNRINDYNKEVTQLMEEIHDLKIELDQLSDERKSRDSKNTQELTRLETIRDTESGSLNHLKKQLVISEEALERIVVAVEAFFETAECSLEPLRERLGLQEELTVRDLRKAFNVLEHHIAAMQLEKELLLIQSMHESKSISGHHTIRLPKVPKPSGGPYEPTLVISSRPELGMERKDDEEQVLFAAAPIPKSVQRDNLLTQLRDLGIVAKKKSPIRLTEPYRTYATKYKRKPLPKEKKKREETSEIGDEGENIDAFEQKSEKEGLGERADETFGEEGDEEDGEMTFIQSPQPVGEQVDETSQVEVPTETEEGNEDTFPPGENGEEEEDTDFEADEGEINLEVEEDEIEEDRDDDL